MKRVRPFWCSRRLKVAAAAGVMLGASSANAELITFQLDGVVTLTTITRAPWGIAEVGTPIRFTYTFNTSTPDSEPLNTSFGHYVGAVTSFRLEALGLVGEGSGGVISVIDHTTPTPGGDRYYVEDMLLSDGFDMYLTFQNHDGSTLPLTSDMIPTSFSLADWQDQEFTVGDLHENRWMAIEWETLTIVPAPGGVGFGIVVMMAVSRRRRRTFAPVTPPPPAPRLPARSSPPPCSPGAAAAPA